MTPIPSENSSLDRGGFLKLVGGAGAAGMLGLAGVDAAQASAGFDPEREPITIVGPPDPSNPRRVSIRTRGLETSDTDPGVTCAAALVALADIPIGTILSLSLVKTGTDTPATGFPPLWTPDPDVEDAVAGLLTGIFVPAPTRAFGFSAETVGHVPPGQIVDLVCVAKLKRSRTRAELRASLAEYHAWVVGRFRRIGSLGEGLRGGGSTFDHQIDYKQPPTQ